MNELELEVFRADEKASRGITSADIAAAASAYDPDKAPAAICIGHPKSDTPAYGVISSLRAEGNRLFAKLKDVKDKVVEGIKNGDLLNRSMAFFSKDHEANPVPGVLYPRHLGFLGASAPGIPGLKSVKKALSFSADDELEVDGDPSPAIVFESKREPTPTFSVTEEPTVDPAKEPTAEELKADREKLAKERAEFEAEREETRKAANKGLVDGLVASGKVTPAEGEKLVPIFNALDAEPLEFEAGKEKEAPAAALAALFAGRDAVVDTKGRKSPTGSPEFSAEDKADPKKIEAAARKLMEEEKSLSFEAAVARVSGQDEE